MSLSQNANPAAATQDGHLHNHNHTHNTLSASANHTHANANANANSANQNSNVNALNSTTYPATPTPTQGYPIPSPRVSNLLADIQRLRDQNRELTIQRDDAEKRSILLQRENAVLKAKLMKEEYGGAGGAGAGAGTVGGGGDVSTSGMGFIMSGTPNGGGMPMTTTWSTEGITLAEDWDNQHDLEKAPKKNRRPQKSHSRALLMSDSTTSSTSADNSGSSAVLADPETAIFNGSLWSYNTAAVRIIAHALSIPTTGIKPELVKRVSEYLENHRELEDNPRFSGLYTAKYRHPASAAGAGYSPAQKRSAGAMVDGQHQQQQQQYGIVVVPQQPDQNVQPMYGLQAIDPNLGQPPSQRRRVDGQDMDDSLQSVG